MSTDDPPDAETPARRRPASADPDEDDFIETLMAEHEAAMTDVASLPDDADLLDVA